MVHLGRLEPVDSTFFDPFRFEDCDACGECLTHCPIMEFSLEDARKEMAGLIAGEHTNKVLSECQSCFTCNFYCEKNAILQV